MLASFVAVALAFHGPATSAVRSSAVSMKGENVPVKNAWVKVASTSDLKPNSLTPTFAAGQDILIAVEKSGSVYATANVCPHIGTPLDQGKLKDGCVVCPLHGTAFDLGTGKLTGEWCPSPPIIGPLTGALKSPRDLAVFPVRQRGANIEVFIDVNARARYDAGFWKGILDAQGKADGGYY